MFDQAEHENVPVAALQMLADEGRPMHLIRIRPAHADVLCSKFKDGGYSSRQALGW